MAQGKLKLDNAASYASELKDINPSIVNDKFLEKNKEIGCAGIYQRGGGSSFMGRYGSTCCTERQAHP